MPNREREWFPARGKRQQPTKWLTLKSMWTTHATLGTSCDAAGAARSATEGNAFSTLNPDPDQVRPRKVQSTGGQAYSSLRVSRGRSRTEAESRPPSPSLLPSLCPVRPRPRPFKASVAMATRAPASSVSLAAPACLSIVTSSISNCLFYAGRTEERTWDTPFFNSISQ